MNVRLLLFAILPLPALFVSAQETLRWKFAAGDRYQVEFSQRTALATEVKGKPVEIKIDMEMDLRWRIDSVNEAGAADMTQTITRMKASVESGEKSLIYDSASRDQPAGPAADFASAAGPLIGAEFRVTLSPRGEVLGVQPPEEAAGILEDAEARQVLGDLFSAEGFSKVLAQASASLPEDPISVGDSWQSEAEFKLSIGDVKQTRSFTYEGVEKRESGAAAKISMRSQLAIDRAASDADSSAASAADKPTALDSQQHEGVFYFDAAAGHLIESSSQQRLVTSRRYREFKLRVQSQVTMTTKVRLLPPE